MINNFCLPPYIDDDDQLTIRTYHEMFYRLERLAINVIHWKNLPTGLKPIILERYLFYFGNVVLFYDDILMRYVGLPIVGEFAWDVNGYPTEYEVCGFKGYRRRLNYTNSVIIWNSYQLNPAAEMTGLLATRLTNTLRTGDMHLENQKIGKIISVPETKRKSVQALIQRIKNFHLYTIGSPAAKDLAESTQALDTELDYIVDKLDAHYSFLWHDALNYYGIDSITDKTSGVNIKESMAEEQMAKANKTAMLNSRQDGVDNFNKMFNQNVQLEFLDGEEEQDVELYDDAENSDGGINREDSSSDV